MAITQRIYRCHSSWWQETETSLFSSGFLVPLGSPWWPTLAYLPLIEWGPQKLWPVRRRHFLNSSPGNKGLLGKRQWALGNQTPLWWDSLESSEWAESRTPEGLMGPRKPLTCAHLLSLLGKGRGVMHSHAAGEEAGNDEGVLWNWRAPTFSNTTADPRGTNA